MRPVYMVASIGDPDDLEHRLCHDIPFTDKLEAELFRDRLERISNPAKSSGHVVIKFFPEMLLVTLAKYFRDRVQGD
jgi:hypothetical protein